jgi:hypothetical protein
MSKTLDENWDAMQARIKADAPIESVIKVYVALLVYAVAAVAPMLGIVGFLAGQAVEGEVQSYVIWAVAYQAAVVVFWGFVVGRTVARSAEILDPTPDVERVQDPRGPHWNDDNRRG